MTEFGKDSAEVVDFLSFYGELKIRCANDPGEVFELANEDAQFLQLCKKILEAVKRLRAGEQRHHRLFAAPVDPEFLSAWRDFEARFENVLEANWNPYSIELEDNKTSDKSRNSTATKRRRERVELDVAIEADLIEKAVEFLRFQDFGDEELEDFGYNLSANEAVILLIDYWENLPNQIGLDFADVSRRRSLVPFVLIPRHVSQHHGDQEKLSLLTHLQQAHDAFIFGLHFAALALMRSILETTLKKHYYARGDDLEKLIHNCEGLPLRCKKGTLDRIRHLANDILHFKKDRVRLPDNFEQELLGLLNVLRALIEGAPSFGSK